MVDDFVAGNQRFRADFGARERASLAGLASHGQRPAAVFIGCSDSRVIPELLTDARPGQLFVIRNVANRVPGPGEGDRSVRAALAYALDQLAVRNVIVCGHDDCGGVRAALDDLAGLDPASDLATWLGALRPAVEAARAASRDPRIQLERAVEENVRAGVATLAREWPELRLHAWVYGLGDGSLRVFDDELDRFVPVA
ncbi:MAG TPA: carbonic anhydrase [Candidatus Limnocylindrales bacterium]